MKIVISINTAFNAWHNNKIINKKLIKKIVNHSFQILNFSEIVKKCEVSVLLTDELEMANLNKKFLKKDKPTNVLAFPSEDSINSIKSKLKLDDLYLGDLAFGYQVIERESLRYKKTFKDHFIHLLVHGILHLLGFDHNNNYDALIMQNLEIDILKKLDIPSPY